MIAGARLARASPWLCRAVPVAAVLFFLAWCYISVRPDFSWDDAEPEILNTAWSLASGRSIYRGIDAPPFSFAAYPPLYYALVALQMMFTGLTFLPARLVSILAAAAIGWAMVRLNRDWNAPSKDGLSRNAGRMPPQPECSLVPSRMLILRVLSPGRQSSAVAYPGSLRIQSSMYALAARAKRSSLVWR